ncbi:hypothetical protein [Mycolicibacterium sp. CBMA 226]|uniref:hypothetical protein n=1 Tax=Mycolicibacterium sp. CBMA 226 TaxID=2606611 RepID=UPI0012DF653F|nr:hypothetical protein [Mycolicibacterium sp. CBMA 226]MUL78872.1 hypothetical protein [Mycolicibacterium sp. CBMA 226]QGW61171.1 hypothetical protein ICEMyc226_00139 [Mycolicibacterium sp.]
MTNPFGPLDAATSENNLFLSPSAVTEITKTIDPYESALQTLINDRLDNTQGYFGTPQNPLALNLESAFNARGKALTTYLTAQLSAAKDLIKTAQDAANATTKTDQN